MTKHSELTRIDLITIQSAIDEVVQAISPKTEFLFSTQDRCVLRSYLFSFLSFSVSVKTLLKAGCFDTIMYVCRGAMERYAIVKKLLELFHDEKSFNVIVKKLVFQEMMINMNDCKTINKDKTIKSKYITILSLLNRNEYLLKTFFADVMQLTQTEKSDMTKRIIQVEQSLNQIYILYNPEFKEMNKISNFVNTALMNNIAYQNKYGEKVESAGFTYSLLSEESHPNFYYIDQRINKSGIVSINNRMHNDDVSMFLLVWCLKDIAYLISDLSFDA